jgi:ATP-binding protein involved in chromosome partitioning
VLGIIESMSYFLCPQCGTRSDIFSHGGARHEAERLDVPFFGRVAAKVRDQIKAATRAAPSIVIEA